MSRRQIRELDGVLEAAVHALAVERHDRMRGVADQQRAAVDVPAIEIQRAEQAGRICVEIVLEVGDQRQRVGEIAREKRARGGRRVDVAKLGSRLRSAGTA